MPEVLEQRMESVQRTVDGQNRSTSQIGDSTYCPALVVFDALRPPRRSSATYIAAIGLHLIAFTVLGIRIHQTVHPRMASVAVNAITLTAPAAPVMPVEERVAAKPIPQLNRHRRQIPRAVLEQPPSPQPIGSLPINRTDSFLPSLFNTPASQVRVTGTAGHPVGADREASSSTAQNPSQAAAPRSNPAPDGALSGARATWEGAVLARLAQFRRYPAASRMRHEEGTVYVRFKLDRTGHVLSADLERSSGFSALDKEALAMISRAQPLPAVPSNLPDVMELSLPIEFFLR